MDSRYIEIAHDMVGRILIGEWSEGTLLKGRSMLAATYNVSPETIRKAINILEKEKIVQVKHGVGVYVDSALRAQQYAEKWSAKSSLREQHETLNRLLNEKRELDQKIEQSLSKMIESFKFQTNEAIVFQEIEVPLDSWANGKTIGDIYFWNYTEATIVAIVSQKDKKTYPSPGPDYMLAPGDKLILVGKDELSIERALSYLAYGVIEEVSAAL